MLPLEGLVFFVFNPPLSLEWIEIELWGSRYWARAEFGRRSLRRGVIVSHSEKAGRALIAVLRSFLSRYS